ncbi:bifunctional 3,4-dihydroxy-2-butanone-4-phosphate synthase/GTP cyclohydrolase II [Propionivibrio sp.]|uniref:bifunctional 3,4-dihydroxy-2-butanone-4-phosphate synthase/GTP cyclohydrolase II n=1 Tax=Propionivibrio sp. TaxID=2212460 RepID=UPI0025ED2728|nr:bifunctional 3,4-dihydroxy-2-butanone-4-phosphate synthase/GTP cyclohydrolase II [Propionivibrio sp.]MBK7355634.1 3,4-dihydroxy-2-butanone-4-phosphate synthase [Propionivibrio sp.]MBK8400697.1 3,4-dihydroxy-2-butanone-4-phosphate synthase [Propionivibrio sp.]MBK8744728.1 3,4-dihydroxy-2-butanone-4-phosphate synthase [Propionivibrio sp.]MBK8893623.1 3,4-dihydroxy-2-butanone-4-phosphate synthase [Propionivibrio sp.]
MSPLSQSPAISTIEEIVIEIRAGRMVILVDEEDRENEGDLILAAEHVTPEAINFMAKHARGLICLTLNEARCKQIGLTPMARDNKSAYNTAFTVSIEAASGVTTGISAQDRARTIQVAVARDARPEDIVQPGHIFPIIAKTGGVLVRAGHTEAGCDLAQIAGLEPSSVICEILKDDGSMARLDDLIDFARVHGLKIGSIADLINFRSRNETLIERTFSKQVQSPHGEFTLHAYTDRTSNEVHLALTRGDISPEKETLVRVHEPLTALDFLDPTSGRHSFSLDQAREAMAKVESGVIVLLRRPETCQELLAALTEQSPAQRPAAKWDPRMYGIGAQILRDLGVRKMKLLASPRRMPSMTGFDLEVTGYVRSPAELE